MSRIHTILEKAERDGTLGRLSPPALDGPSAAPPFAADDFGALAGGTGRDSDAGAVSEASNAPAADEGHGPAAPAASEPAFSPADDPTPSVASVPRGLDGTAASAAHARATSLDLDSGVIAPLPPPSAAATPAPIPPPARDAIVSRLAESLIAVRQPHALVSEQFRALRTRLTHSINGRGARVLLVTSPGRGEGKSTVAANLAITMGQEIRQRVCLVDAALRGPSVHGMFGLPQSPGLSDVLAGRVALESAIVDMEPYQLFVLTAGTVPANPAELLGGTDMRRIVALLRSRFDRVVIDGAAAAPTADVATLLPLVDGTVVVARAGRTVTPDLTHTVAAIGSAHVLGVVLNDVEA